MFLKSFFGPTNGRVPGWEVCGRKEPETVLPWRRLCSHLEGKPNGKAEQGRVGAPNHSSPQEEFRATRGSLESGVSPAMPTPQGQVLAPVCMLRLFQAACLPIPMPPSSPPPPFLTCGGSSEGMEVPRRGRSLVLGKCVPSYTRMHTHLLTVLRNRARDRGSLLSHPAQPFVLYLLSDRFPSQPREGWLYDGAALLASDSGLTD